MVSYGASLGLLGGPSRACVGNDLFSARALSRDDCARHARARLFSFCALSLSLSLSLSFLAVAVFFFSPLRDRSYRASFQSANGNFLSADQGQDGAHRLSFLFAKVCSHLSRKHRSADGSGERAKGVGNFSRGALRCAHVYTTARVVSYRSQKTKETENTTFDPRWGSSVCCRRKTEEADCCAPIARRRKGGKR
jgi:hypothetical protein